jgi:3',5'-cyclic AMP phosphodiesterase CpdA
VRFKIIIAATVALVIVGVGLGMAAVLGGGGSEGGGSEASGGKSAMLLAAGDIAECDHQGDEATAEILAQYPDATIATLGDNAYQEGTDEQFKSCYDASWGKFKDRTMPATGNHDESTKNAQGYWDYFGDRGGPYDKYYYSYDLGSWHLVVLNSDCWRVDGCAIDDPQAEWLRNDLEKNPALCTIAYWHRPPFSSGRYGGPGETGRVRPLWQVLNEEGVDILLTGHEHSYERFAPMNTAGERDDKGGVRLFVVGTGGGNLRPFENPPLPTTEVRDDETWGVLKLDLGEGRYSWKFLPVAGSTFSDSGSGTCH